jgi:hypothetical protein
MRISLNRCTISWIIVLFLLPTLVACNLTGGAGNAPADNSANATATAIFQTLDAQSAELTVQAGGQPQAPATTEQPPAETQPPAQTEPPVLQPGQPTVQAGAVLSITATINTNCYSGPSKKYPKFSSLRPNVRSTVLGKDVTGTWWYIKNRKKAGGYCWVSAETTKVEGDTTQLPIIEPMPLSAAQTQAAQTEIPQAPVAPVNQTPNPTLSP